MRGGLAAVLACAAALAGASVASADDAPYVPWTPLLPAFPMDFRPSVFEECADGAPTCIDETLDEMWRRFHRVVGECNHNAVFALTYIRVTEDYKAADARNVFDDPRYFAHEDRVFARLYFNAYDNWAAGRADLVPAAWRIAFDTAARKEVNGLGNLLMSMNAHVNRDMPFMLAGLGLTGADGRSHKPDHDRFNEFLNDRYDQILREIGLRFDFSTAGYDQPATTLDNLTLIQLLVGWREQVWRHAELLINAPSDAARRAISDYIEDYAYSIGREIRRFLPNGDPEQRESTCARHSGQRPYNFRPPHLGEDPLTDPPPQTIGAPRAAVRRGGIRAGPDGRFSVVLGCPARPGDCKGSVRLVRRTGSQRLGSRGFSVQAASRRRLRLRLNPRGRRLLARGRPVAVELHVRTPDATSSDPWVQRVRTTLRRR